MFLLQYSIYNPKDKKRKEALAKLVFPEGETKDNFETRIKRAIHMLKNDWRERTLLLALRGEPNNYLNAFNKINKNSRTIYVHAY